MKPIVLLSLFLMRATLAESSCVDPGACYTLSGEIISCETKDADSRRILIVTTEKNQAEIGTCAIPAYREAAQWEKDWAISKFEKSKAFVVYPAPSMSCDTLPRLFEKVSVAENCCDTIPPSVECTLKLNVLRIKD